MAWKTKWKNPSGTRAYYAWRSMRSRCLNPKNAAFQHYGGRGIKVCPEWVDDYDAFFADMGEPPEGLSLDRIDFNGDYSKENCRWAGWEVQETNKRTARLLTHNGVTKNVSLWARELGVSNDVLFARLKYMSVDKALTPGLFPPRTWSHGTRTGYDKGCRCSDCRAAHAARFRARRARRKAET